MGKVIVPARIENLADLFEMDKGTLTPENVRRIEVQDALVDTGATTLSLPKRLIDQLGLKHLRSRRVRTSAGVIDANVYGTVLLTVQGRDCRVDVTELPDGCPILIGQVPLELLDWVVDPQGQRLIGNPDHGGEHMYDQFFMANSE